MPDDVTKAPASLGAKLRATLTDDQVQTLLDVVGEAGHLEALDAKLRSADPDLADAVRRILERPRTDPDSGPSARKTAEIWKGLWSTWSGCISEVGEEEGPYVNHEEHWHPPYFDHSALEADLEEAATGLLEWIERAFPLVREPHLFLDSLAELNRNMRSFPEWFQPVEDNFGLGPLATTCVMRWTWLGLGGQTGAARPLVDTVCALDVAGKHAELDSDATRRFFIGLPENACREIHAYLRESHFQERVARLGSTWQRIQHELEGRFDPAMHLQTCEERLEQDWSFGEPLVAAAVARQDFAAAEKLFQRTCCSLLGWEADKPWCPESLLVPACRYYRTPEESDAVEKLLERWEELAVRCGKAERAANLKFQRVVLASPEDWTAALEAFLEYQRHLRQPAKAEWLLVEWQQRMADVCSRAESENKPSTDTWTHRLIEAQRSPASKQEEFVDCVEIWLQCCQEHVAFFNMHWRSLALLTRHLPQHGEAKAACPTFHSHVLVPALPVSADMEKSLRHALDMLGAKTDRIRVKPVWERHLLTLVPTPRGSGSDYRESALWMKALSEVNPAAYEKALNRWKSEFRRRRNLWQAMAAAACPGF